MKASDIWTYPIGTDAVSGKANMPAWQRLSWINHDTKNLAAELCRHDDGGTKDKTNGGIYTRICYIDKRVREMRSIIDQQSKQISALTQLVNKLAQPTGNTTEEKK